MNRIVFAHLIVTAALLAGPAAPATAGTHRTAGAIASLTVPDGFTAQYDRNSDVTLLNRSAQSQIMIVAGPAVPPRDGMVQLLQLFNVTHLAPQIQDAAVAGLKGVRLDVVTQMHERWYVLAAPGASLVIRAADPASFQALDGATQQVVASVSLAPATHPPLVAGSYDTGYYRSGMGDYGTSDGGAVFAESGMTLLPDGSLRSSGSAGASSGVGTVLSGSSGRGRWEVRGERLLMVHADGTVASLRVQAFSNGLELWNGQGGKLLWSRR